uniref:Proprotein convertase subtilisin/kexin type 5b n=1 Tax=Nothobranchius furzeri TaxID=105023 RepID=A0A8C6Q3I3_NOTFU
FSHLIIGDLRDHYHFYHSRTIKRSTLSSRGRHSFISMEPKVEWIEQQVVKRRIKRDYKAALPLSQISPAHSSVAQNNIFYNDAKWSSMWYIHCNDDVNNCQSDMNIMGAWKRGYTGKDVVVTILDDGIERNHPDLLQNYDPQASFDVNSNDADPMPRYDATNENKHGTRCAGEVAASANNTHCIVGIAYNARIGGVRMLDGDVTDMVEARSLSLNPQHIDIYSASWGPDDDGKTVDGPASLARQAFENGIRLGRKGRGSIFVWASGNGGRSRDHCSCDGYTNSIYTISISSTAESGRKPWYLEECSSTLTTTYSSGENYDRKIITTDLRHRCTDSHTGTSASAPMAAAIIALALEANPLLTWRDVQHIIVKTSRAGHLSAPDWKTNAAGYNVSHLYGFGLMDAEAMVKEAEQWKQVPSQHICMESADRQFRSIRPEHVLRSVYKATGCADNPNSHVIYLEHVVVRITIAHSRRGDLSINLTSPSGTKSQLLANRLFDHSMEGFKNWEFMTTHCWGEKASGDWVLEIYDSPSQLRSQKLPGKLKEWSLVLYGTSVHPYSSMHSSLHAEKQPRFTDMLQPVEEEFTEEYNGPCHAECNDGCEGPGPQHCNNCLHYFFKFKNNTRMCVSECPSGFFRDDRKRCKKCSSTCETCVGSRSDQCITCRPGFHFIEDSNTCVVNCGDSFYLDRGTLVCTRCLENCKKCTSSSICTECKPGMSLQGDKCQMTCDPGTYYNGHRRTCEPCHRACATCAGVEACTKCAEGYLLEDWRCVSSCSHGTYLLEQPLDNGQVQRSCKKCDNSCFECLGPGERNCSSCNSGYNLEAGACMVSTICKDGQYMNKHGKCHLCDVTCEQCTGPESEDCISCPETRFYADGLCVIRCPTGRYAAERQCHLCHHTCQACDDEGPDNCTSCGTDKFGVSRYLYQTQCREVCPEGFFHSERKQCEPCPNECVMCAAADHCLRCAAAHKLRNGHCFPLECSEGEDGFSDAEKEDCGPCDDGCEKCQIRKLGADCQKFCPDRTYNVEDTMVCAACEDKHCAVCDQSQCYWCDHGFFVFGNNGECVDHCEEGYFVDEETQECEPCHRNCRTCGGPRHDDCDSCEDGVTLSDGECLERRKLVVCPEKYFVNNQDKCEPCHTSCNTCFGAEKGNCSSCHSGNFLTPLQSCLSHCPSGTFGDKTTGRCEECLTGCAMCREAERGFPQGAACHPCASECGSCRETPSHCLSCQSPFLLLDHSCLSSCPEEFYRNNTECHHCPDHCRECNQDGLCKKCAEYYFLHVDECVDDCPEGYFASDKQQECVRCHADCASCDGPGFDDCDRCSNTRAVRYNGECLAKCPSNTYYDKNTNECRDCDKSCLTCSGYGPSDCLSCDPSRRKDASGHCVWYSECSMDSYMDPNGECQQCHALCNRCNGADRDHCLSCNSQRFLLNNTCVKKCPVGYYTEVKEGRECQRCHFSCESCVGNHSLQCVACKPGYFRQGGSCVETCSESTKICERCDPSCSQCFGPGNRNCLSCRGSYVFMKQWRRCLKSCPLGYYKDKRSTTCSKCHPTCKTCSGKKKERRTDVMWDKEMKNVCVDSESKTLKCKTCDPSCEGCWGSSSWQCTLCPPTQLLSDDGRCLSCCGNPTFPYDKPIPRECCDCEASRGEQNTHCEAHFAAKISQLLHLFNEIPFHEFVNRCPRTRAGGYEQLNTNGGFMPQTTTSAFGEYSDKITECEDNDEEYVDEDIVYMTKDGTVYRKFKYGLLDDDDVELEYDDESYTFR